MSFAELAVTPDTPAAPAAPAAPRVWRLPGSRTAVVGVLAVAALALWGWPLLALLPLAVFPGWLHGDLHPGAQALRAALDSGAVTALEHSALVSGGAAALALLAGSWLAWLRTRTTVPWRGAVEAAMWLLLVMPGYLLASGCMLLAAPDGPLGGWPPALEAARMLFGPLGIVTVLGTKAIPFVYLALEASLAGLGAAPLEAAAVLGLGRGQRLRMAAALLLPALAAGFAAAFAESVGDFAVAATLGAGSGFTMATTAIEQSINGVPLDFGAAAAASWMLLALVAPALGLQAVARRRAVATLGPRHRPAAPRRLSAQAHAGHAAGALALAAVGLGLPVWSALGLAFGGDVASGPADAFATVLGALGYSLELGIAAGTVTVLLAWPVAALSSRGGAAARGLDLVMVTVMALPGIVLAAADVLAYNQPLTPLYGGSLLLGMAYVALAVPAASRVLQGPVAQIHRRLREAALVHGVSPLRALLRIELPLLARPLFSAWLLAVLHISFELPASELLYPPGHPPLAVALLTAASSFSLAQQARVQLLGMGLLLGFAAVARLVFGRLAPGGEHR